VSTIPERFAELARRQPEKVAIAGTSWQPTYRELDAAADRIAHSLGPDGAGAGRIALLMDHDAHLIAAMLGVLRAGSAIVVLNPGDPAGRLDRIRRQVEPRLALVDHSHRHLAMGAGFETVVEAASRLDETGNGVPDGGAPPRPDPDPGDLAAVMFTSGSTGRPKGVMHTHHTLLQTARRHSTALGLRGDDRVALLASPSGGHGMGTTWMTLMSGATLCPFPVMDRGVAGLPGWLRDRRITVLGLSASLFRRLVRSLDGQEFPDLRLVRLGSEQVRRADFDACRRHFGEHCAFANVYSMTEGGGLAHFVIAAGEAPRPGPLPAGRAAEGVEILLLDERGRPVGPGGTGEIVALSSHLSPGYYGDERLTETRFAPNGRNGKRTLATGDLGLLNEDGDLVVVGRRDAQVKIRGYRVELAEVEAALRSVPGVDAAAARAEPTRHGDGRLTAYVVSRPEAALTPAGLRDALRGTLSEASIPTAFGFVEELPLNAHGKVDRERLGTLPRTSTAGASAPPTSPIERELSEIWATALELDEVGRGDDFFELAGDSLAGAEIGAGVFQAFGVEVDIRAFATHPTVARMAELIAQRRRGRGREAPRLERVSREAPLPCTFAQERIWPSASEPETSPSHTVTMVSRFDASTDVDALRAALAHVVARHEPIHTTFIERAGEPLQVINRAGPVEVPLTDLTGSSDPDGDALELLRKLAAEPFDLERGPLLRLHLVRLPGGELRLMRMSSHLICDRRSWQIFFDELAPAYEAIRRGEGPPAADDRLQFADFAAWQRRTLRPEGAGYREQLSFWRLQLGAPPPPLRLPFARRTPDPDQPASAGNLNWGIDPAVAEILDRLGRAQGATHHATRLALFSALLALEAERDEVTIGAYVDTRRHPQTRSMFGYFPNLVTLILPFDPGATLRAWMMKVRFILNEAIAHSDLPYQHLCEELLDSGVVPPEINAIFSTRQPMPELSFGEAEVPHPGLIAMPWGFSFVVHQGNEASRCQVTFDAHLYDPAAVRRFVDRYTGLAEAAASRPDEPLGHLHTALA
jgi:amino acid adenylation domain-containing protein